MGSSDISEHLSLPRLFRACISPILMMIAISVYSVVDGFFVSNFAGNIAFAAVNIVWPFVMLCGTIGFMMGTGGTALVAKRMGEKKTEDANCLFFNCVVVTASIGILTTLATVFFMPGIARMLGANEEMLPYCVDYGRIMICGITFFNLQNMFQPFFPASGKPHLGFFITIGAGVANIVLDGIFVGACGLGCAGAAWATIIGQAIGGVLPLVYYACKNKSALRLVPSKMDWKSLGKMGSNGFSEFVSQVSVSAVSMVMNVLLMKYYQENGVSAYGIIAYVWLVFASGFIGLCMGIAPRISYAYGEKNTTELCSLLKNALILLGICGIVQFILAEALAVPISYAYASYDESLRQLTVHASIIYSIIYLFLGFNMFASSFFTALNNGWLSAAISFVRLVLFECLSSYLCSLFLGGEGIWWGVVIGEALSIVLVFVLIFAFGRKYGYRKSPGEIGRTSD